MKFATLAGAYHHARLVIGILQPGREYPHSSTDMQARLREIAETPHLREQLYASVARLEAHTHEIGMDETVMLVQK